MEYLILYLIGFPAFFYIAVYGCQMNETEVPLWLLVLGSIVWPPVFILAVLTTILQNVEHVAKKRYASRKQ